MIALICRCSSRGYYPPSCQANKGENSGWGEGPPRRGTGDIGSEEVEVEEKSQGGLWEMSGVELEQVFWDSDTPH